MPRFDARCAMIREWYAIVNLGDFPREIGLKKGHHFVTLEGKTTGFGFTEAYAPETILRLLMHERYGPFVLLLTS